MNSGSVPRLRPVRLVVVALFALAVCAGPQARAQAQAWVDEENPYGAVAGDFCWSEFPLLTQEKTCAEPAVYEVAQDACTRIALDAITHSHAANRDWFGSCMARHGLSRLENK